MARRLLAIAFVLAAFAPEAFVSAQQSSQQKATHATTSTKSTAASHNTNRNGHNMQRRHGNVPPWSNSVYVNGGSAAQYLATSKPKPPPAKNKVNSGGGEVFKSISN
ncbi:MAG TPA: hypothetical protein VGG22_11110 [Candidatus Baltobacteraceae bacterium]|jgi:hypothetical protein